MTNGLKMLEDCVETISVKSDATGIFFWGIISAELKVKVSYCVKAVILSQFSGIMCSSCDCPVGQGPNATW